MNTHEQYISLETAKLLKKAGFDWEVYSLYDTDYKDILFTKRVACLNWNMSDNGYMFSAPTQAVAMRWLREVKDIDVEVMRCIDVKVYNAIYVYHGETIIIKHLPTYEQAAEASIQECLKIILNKQEQ